MTIGLSQETPPDSFEGDQKEYLSRRFIDLSTALSDAQHANPLRKQMPYKPQVGHTYYFGDPATHNYDAQITEPGLWLYSEVYPATAPVTYEWLLMSPSFHRFDTLVLEKNTTDSFANGATIDDYEEAVADNEDRQTLTYSLANGIITINAAGWYDLNFYVTSTGSSNNDYYGVYLSTETGDFLIGSKKWDQNNPGMTFEASIVTRLSADTTFYLYAFATGGTLDVEAVRMSIAWHDSVYT